MNLDLDLFRAGDPAVMADYRMAVRKQLRRWHSDRATIDDLTDAVIGDLMEDALRSDPEELPQTHEAIWAWMRNTCRTHARRELKRRRRWATFVSFWHRRGSPRLTFKFRARRVLAWFDEIASKLPRCDHQIFQMRAAGMSPTEIAKELGCTTVWVKARLKRIRDRLEVELLGQTQDPSISLGARLRAHRRLHSVQRAELW